MRELIGTNECCLDQNCFMALVLDEPQTSGLNMVIMIPRSTKAVKHLEDGHLDECNALWSHPSKREAFDQIGTYTRHAFRHIGSRGPSNRILDAHLGKFASALQPGRDPRNLSDCMCAHGQGL